MGEQLSQPKGAAAGSRKAQVQDWLRTRADSALGRLALQWFRAYFGASRNTGCAITVYSSLSVLPAALVFLAVLHIGSGDANVFAQHLVHHLRLKGDTATLVKGTFGTASANAAAATLTTVVSFLLWGIGIGQLYQDVYARAWGIKVGSAADQALYAIFFFVFAGSLALLLAAQAELGGTARWALLVPAFIVGSIVFWLAVPHFLLHRKIGTRELLPGALLATLVLGGTAAVSPLFLPATLTTDGKAFGSFGIVLTVVGYFFVMITLSLVCAVFSPVWLRWREGEKRLDAAAPAPP
jgi:hypothetical protein